jgi:hypothetical protein
MVRQARRTRTGTSAERQGDFEGRSASQTADCGGGKPLRPGVSGRHKQDFARVRTGQRQRCGCHQHHPPPGRVSTMQPATVTVMPANRTRVINRRILTLPSGGSRAANGSPCRGPCCASPQRPEPVVVSDGPGGAPRGRFAGRPVEVQASPPGPIREAALQQSVGKAADANWPRYSSGGGLAIGLVNPDFSGPAERPPLRWL